MSKSLKFLLVFAIVTYSVQHSFRFVFLHRSTVKASMQATGCETNQVYLRTMQLTVCPNNILKILNLIGLAL